MSGVPMGSREHPCDPMRRVRRKNRIENLIFRDVDARPSDDSGIPYLEHRQVGSARHQKQGVPERYERFGRQHLYDVVWILLSQRSLGISVPLVLGCNLGV